MAEENILTPDSLLHMLELHNKVLAIKADNKTWTDLCYRIPIADIFLTKRRKKRQIAIGEKPDWYVVSAFIFYDLASFLHMKKFVKSIQI